MRAESPTQENPTPARIVDTCLQEGRRTLFAFAIPLDEVRTAPKEGEIRPYLSTFYDKGTLENINVKAYLPELISDASFLDPEAFRHRTRTGIKEEAIHGIQILSVRLKYSRLPEGERLPHGNAETYYNNLQERLFVELTSTAESQRVLICAGQLYYADPSIKTVDDLQRLDKKRHGRSGYVTIELIRQIIQARTGDALSEEARAASWDKKGHFPETERALKELVATIRAHAKDPAAISPMMGEIIRETESLLMRDPLPKSKPRPKTSVEMHGP